MRSRLKWQIMIRIAVSITVVLSILFTFIFFTVDKTFKDHAKQSSEYMATSLANEVNRTIENQIQLLEHYASAIMFTYQESSYQQSVYESKIDTLTRYMLKDNHDMIYGYWYTSESSDRGLSVFTSRFAYNDGRILRHGNVINVDEAAQLLYNDTNHKLYSSPSPTGKRYITKPFIDKCSGEPMITIGTLVVDDTGAIMGVAGMDIRVKYIQEIGMDIQEELNGTAMITTGSGDLIFHPDASDDITKEKIKDNIYTDFADQFHHGNYGPNYVLTNISDHFYRFGIELPSTGWIAIVKVPREEIEGGVRRLLQWSVILFLLSLVVCYVMIHWWVDKRINDPIKAFMRGTEAVAVGDWDHRVALEHPNELVELASKFNWMLDSMRRNLEVEEEMKRLSALNVAGQMASALSHEVRNPLTAISGFLQLLRKKKEYAEDHMYFDVMIDEVNRANTIITEYLSLSKERKSNFELRDLNQMIEMIYPLIQASASGRCQTVTLELAELPKVHLDEMEIRQLLHNLTRNGLEAMEENKQLIIRTLARNSQVVLQIQDQGTGMDEQVINQLGKPFLTTKENGTGLGLAICLSIIRRHRAEYRIQSSEQGTIFEVAFPSMDSMA